MARPLRIEFPDAVYHVTVRGNRKGVIFDDDNDRLFFLSLLQQTVERYNLVCHAYCLMGNHYHLLLETPDGNLSASMHYLNGNYAQAHNRRRGTVGHFFQGRFHAFLIEKDAYLLNVGRYTILNPVRAGLVKRPREWKWSSYAATAGYVVCPSFLTTDFLLGCFSKDRTSALRAYRQFVREGMKVESPFLEAKPGAILGHQMFVDWVWENVTRGSESLKEITKTNRLVGRPTLRELFKGVFDKEHRYEMIRRAHVRCGYSLTDIAKHLSLSRIAISKIYHYKD